MDDRTNDSATDSAAEDQGPSLTCGIAWADEQIAIKHCQKLVRKMKEFCTTVMEFDNMDECVATLEDLEKRRNNLKIIFITSGRFSAAVIPRIQDLSIVKSILIFCFDLEKVQKLKFVKLRKAINLRRELLTEIEEIICSSEESLPFSFHSNSEEQLRSSKSTGVHSFGAMKNVTISEARFFWFSIYHKFLLQIDNDDREISKSEMIRLAEQKFRDNSKKINDIKNFESQSFQENPDKIIEYYASNGFLCPLLNDILTSENYQLIYQCRYGIRLLCMAIKRHHEHFIRKYRDKEVILYRGQVMKLEELRELKKQTGVLISFNNFVSTSTSMNVALNFAENRAKKQKGERVLIIMRINVTANLQTPMADVSEYSRFQEYEVLLSIGSVFQVSSIEYEDSENLYIIRLSLSERENSKVTKYIQENYTTEYDPTNLKLVFGKILLDLDQTEFAVEFHEHCVKNLSDDENEKRPIYLNNLGICYLQKGLIDRALRQFLMAHQIYESRKCIPEVAACEHNIAMCYYRKGQYDKARNEACKSRGKRTSIQDQVETLNLLGLINIDLFNIDTALTYFTNAFELLQKHYHNEHMNHPLVGETLFNIALINLKQCKYIDADESFKRAAKIFEANYGLHHTKVIQVNEQIENIRKKIYGS